MSLSGNFWVSMLEIEENLWHDATISRHFSGRIPHIRQFSGIMPKHVEKRKENHDHITAASHHLTGIFPVKLSDRVSC